MSEEPDLSKTILDDFILCVCNWFASFNLVLQFCNMFYYIDVFGL